jgi:hypothetical protein
VSEQEIKSLHAVFHDLDTKREGSITQSDFRKAFGSILSDPALTGTLFAFFDQNRDGKINFKQWVSGESFLSSFFLSFLRLFSSFFLSFFLSFFIYCCIALQE